MSFILLFVYLASIAFSLILAFSYRRFLRERKLWILVPYLLLVFIQETTLALLIILDIYKSNGLVYNIYKPVNVLVFAYIYYSIPFMKPARPVIVTITSLYLVTTLINYLFFESIFATSTYLTLARGFVITFFAILFLFRYFNLDNLKEEKYWQPLIWITIGIATFYPVISISLSFQKYLTEYTVFGMKLYQSIPKVMSIFMYGCFSYAFYICQRRKLTS